jgi:hypothetical protein
MGDKEKSQRVPFSSPKREDETPSKKDKSFKLNGPSVPMRRKNKILGDGKDWFDTHPDA